MTNLSVDFETLSTVDLRKCGVHIYAADPTTGILCMSWAFDDEDPQTWYPLELDYPASVWMGKDYFPERVVDHVRSGGKISAWNAAFERWLWWRVLGPRYGVPRPKLTQFYDTAADAAALCLPRSLDQASKALGLEVTKDSDGYRLMMQMCKPRSNKDGVVTWWHEAKEGPAKILRLGAYCEMDVTVERAIAKRIRPLGKKEREVYLMDQRMNDRGVMIDVPLVVASQTMVDEGLRRANKEVREITDGKVQGVTKLPDMKRWMEAAGYQIENLRKDTIRDMLADLDGLSEPARRILELRSEAGKASTSKLSTMLSVASRFDFRARGLYLYHGAGTGRWAGKLIQTQNFPRPVVGCDDRCASHRKDKATGKNKKCDCGGIERFIPMVLNGEFDMIESGDATLLVISSLLRSMIRAAPGNRLLAGDYAQIEARIVAWIAGQDDLCALFASGGKIYETMAAFIYGVPIEGITKTDFRRQVGKNTVLGCGFGMGPDTFVSQAKTQTGLDIPMEDAEKAVGGYRKLYSKIKDFWKEIQAAAVSAILNPGETFACGRNNSIKYSFRGQFLWCVLPSGRPLAYAKPDVRQRTVKMKDRITVNVDGTTTVEKGKTFTSESICYMGVHPKTKKWVRQWAYGGLLTENVVQAMARDLLVDSHLRHEKAGYMPVLTAHDEAVSEAPEDHGSLDEYLDLMRVLPSWAEGLPVEVEGWSGLRFRK